MRQFAVPCLAILALVLATGEAEARAKPVRDAAPLVRYKSRVLAASVLLPERGCAGSVVRSAREVLTAAHCIPENAFSVAVKLPDGTETSARVAHVDEATDLALLELESAAQVTPLQLADDAPRRGATLLFVGRTNRRTKTQLVRVDRVDRCPSLPELPNALFTSLDARPGDSGAPLVDSRGRVSAIVHGGARCEIAVPTAALGSVRLDTPSPPRPSASPAAPREPQRDKGTAKDDSSFFERTDRGFRFRWSFRWSSD